MDRILNLYLNQLDYPLVNPNMNLCVVKVDSETNDRVDLYYQHHPLPKSKGACALLELKLHSYCRAR